MKKVLFFLVLSAFVGQSFAQKPALTWDVIDHTDWERFNIRDLQISDDGAFVSYNVGGQNTLQATTAPYKKVKTIGQVDFLPGSNLCVEQTGDSLRVYRTGGLDIVKTYIDVTSYQLGTSDHAARLFAQMKNSLLIIDPASLTETTYPAVTRFMLSESGHNLLYVKQDRQQNELHLLNMSTAADNLIAATDGKFNKLIINQAENQIAASVTYPAGAEKKQDIIVYDINKQKLATIDNASLQVQSTFFIDPNELRFAANGNILLLRVQPVTVPKDKVNTDSVALHIWNYQDESLPNITIPFFKETENDPNEDQPALPFALNLTTGRAVHIMPETGSDFSHGESLDFGPENSSFAIEQTVRHSADHQLNKKSVFKVIDLYTGTAKFINTGRHGWCFPSPDGRHILIWDGAGAFLAYDTQTEKSAQLTDPHQLVTQNRFDQKPIAGYYGIAGWLNGGRSVLIYSEFDIWKLDMQGKNPPLCITRHEGEKTHTMLRLALSGDGELLGVQGPKSIDAKNLILLGQDFLTKNQGMYSFDVNGKTLPQKLFSGPYFLFTCFDLMGHVTGEGDSQCIVRSANGATYAMVRSDVVTGANLFVKSDGEKPVPLTQNDPYADYNWMTSELLSWHGPDRQLNQGILFKPENFEPHKKYPVIVAYYEKEAAQLYAPHPPERQEWTGMLRNIGYYVSNGYLVFVPDTYCYTGDQRFSTINSIVPGVKALLGRPYVDAGHIGTTGTSWGGSETNWLVTGSGKLFAAAFAEVGGSDMFTSFYTFPEFTVTGWDRMGAPPWERPDLYTKNSAVLFAPQVQTPLALMNNNLDGLCPVPFGLEMFEYLRILNKPAWLLQYEYEGHGVYSRLADVADYRLRFQQFFDFYLRQQPEPDWMKPLKR